MEKTPRPSLPDSFFSTSWPSAILIFLIAFWTRYRELLEIPRSWLAPNPTWELDSIAISLVNTGKFADPYMIPTGPTAHLPPIYPWLVSLIYRAFGLTNQAGMIRFTLLILSASLMYAMTPWWSEKLGLGRRAGFLGGLTGAVIVEWAGHGEYLTGIGLAATLLIFYRRWSSSDYRWSGSLFLGVFSGVLFHVQPSLIPVVIGCLIFEVWWSKIQRKLFQVALVILGILAASLPWGWRNYRVFGEITFIRSNFGLELRMGNHEGAAATMEVMDQNEEKHRHPRVHISDVQQLRKVGEIEYMRLAKMEALDWIRSNPGQFAWLSVQRIFNLWFGPPYRVKDALLVTFLTILALIGIFNRFPGLSPPQRSVLLIPLLTYPMIYYFVAYMPRYRVPIDWLIYVLAGAGIISVMNSIPGLLKKNPSA